MVELTAWRCPLNPGLAADRILGDLAAGFTPPGGIRTECVSRVSGASVGRAASLPFSSDLVCLLADLEWQAGSLPYVGERKFALRH
jgi:hypothetical protein